MLSIAVSKGRILKDTRLLLAAAGIEPVEDPHTSRKLIFETHRGDAKLIVIRASDVPTFVEHRAADIGNSGKDVLLEYPGEPDVRRTRLHACPYTRGAVYDPLSS